MNTAAPAPPPTPDPTQVHIPAVMPFFWLACAGLCGAVGASWLRLPWQWWAGMLGLCLLGALGHAKRRFRWQPRKQLPLSLLAAGFCLAALLYQLSLPKDTAAFIGYYVGKGEVEVLGVVSETPEAWENGQELVVEVQAVNALSADVEAVRPEKVRGKILLRTMPGSAYAYGDLLSIRGELTEAGESGTFSYKAYLFHQGISALSQYARVELLQREQGSPFYTAIYRLRERSLLVSRRIFPEPEGALLRGILLGERSGISAELQNAYSLTGTAHIIAISGFNMAVLAGLITGLFTRKLGAWRGGGLAILTLAFYTVLVGADASVVRAALMSSLGIMGASINRRGSGLNSLGLVVCLMLLFNPHLPWDIGFQLSAAATVGILLFSAPMQARLRRWLEARVGQAAARGLSDTAGEYLLTTFAAQALTLPLVLYHFQEISPLFLLANPLVLPAQPLVMLLGMLALLGGLLSLGLGKALAWLAWLPAAYTNRAVLWLAGLLPTAWRFPPFSFFWVLAAWALALSLAVPLKHKPAKALARPIPLMIIGASLVVLVWSTAARAPDGQLHLRAFNSPEQPVLLVRGAEGRYLLVGGSLPSASLKQQLGSALPPFQRELDALIIPACGKDDVQGLFGLSESFRIGAVYWACNPERLQTTRRLYETFQSAGVLQRRLQPQDELLLGGSAVLGFTLGEDALKALSLRSADFSALVQFESAVNLEPVSLWLGAFAQEMPDAQARLAVGPRLLTDLEQNPEISRVIALSEWTWVEAATDGHALRILAVK
ncbi:MAG TPA: ComEC/Rec2 family competence protein [Anaerolineaceae bacterium]|nr:ComEC/Rec2 family competence protein [Anaerolineaceae bacterium]